ncbi:hypothetical protein [Natronomonas sp. LN261]|uniref:hypothetical protein n=1 Tax=Natronomonas sp. LN261 TaxID=2750669 RepID=UPI0015EF1215|nr:hypothetical protein [Natronomonas sp. LN261]
MPLSNRDGTPIDPVPFAVVGGLAFMLLLSVGPLYGLAYGLSLPVSLAVSTVLYAVVAVGAFYRQVWDAHPRRETPVRMRAEQLFHGALAFAVVLVAVTLPLVT